MENKIIDLAKKLKALADRGIGGEKVNAEKMLSDLLKKHNLTIEDIEGEKQEYYFFTIKPNDEINIRLLNQIIKRVNYDLTLFGPISPQKVNKHGFGGNLIVECTAAEYIEIESMFNIYKKLIDSEYDVFFRAFCTANDLLGQPKKATTTKELSPEEYEKLMRANAMADNIKKENRFKQLKSYEL